MTREATPRTCWTEDLVCEQVIALQAAYGIHEPEAAAAMTTYLSRPAMLHGMSENEDAPRQVLRDALVGRAYRPEQDGHPLDALAGELLREWNDELHRLSAEQGRHWGQDPLEKGPKPKFWRLASWV